MNKNIQINKLLLLLSIVITVILSTAIVVHSQEATPTDDPATETDDSNRAISNTTTEESQPGDSDNSENSSEQSDENTTNTEEASEETESDTKDDYGEAFGRAKIIKDEDETEKIDIPKFEPMDMWIHSPFWLGASIGTTFFQHEDMWDRLTPAIPHLSIRSRILFPQLKGVGFCIDIGLGIHLEKNGLYDETNIQSNVNLWDFLGGVLYQYRWFEGRFSITTDISGGIMMMTGNSNNQSTKMDPMNEDLPAIINPVARVGVNFNARLTERIEVGVGYDFLVAFDERAKDARSFGPIFIHRPVAYIRLPFFDRLVTKKARVEHRAEKERRERLIAEAMGKKIGGADRPAPGSVKTTGEELARKSYFDVEIDIENQEKYYNVPDFACFEPEEYEQFLQKYPDTQPVIEYRYSRNGEQYCFNIDRIKEVKDEIGDAAYNEIKAHSIFLSDDEKSHLTNVSSENNTEENSENNENLNENNADSVSNENDENQETDASNSAQ